MKILCMVFMIMQFTTYTEIKGRFSNHLWLDVVSKCDLLHESPSSFITEDLATDNPDLSRYRMFGPEGAIRVSVMNGLGLDEVCIYFFLALYTEKQYTYPCWFQFIMLYAHLFLCYCSYYSSWHLIYLLLQLKQKVHSMLISQSDKIKSQIIDPESVAIPTW